MHLELSPKNQAAYDRALSNGLTPEEIQELIFNVLDSSISSEVEQWMLENKNYIQQKIEIGEAQIARGEAIDGVRARAMIREYIDSNFKH